MQAASLAELYPAIDQFADTKILCIGDVMLDRFVSGDVSRISPEAPIPVLTQQKTQLMPGGAGNVVRNIASLGAQSCLIAVLGNDEAGHALTGLLGQTPRLEPYILRDSTRPTTQKTRYIAGTQQLLRCDEEQTQRFSTRLEEEILTILEREIPHHDAVILSDYAKGLLSDDILHDAIRWAKRAGIPVLIDPKRTNFHAYHDATLISPNLMEFNRACGLEHAPAHEQDIFHHAKNLCDKHALQQLLVTAGKDGMYLYHADTVQGIHIPAHPRHVFDVSGAGDTVMATLAIALAHGLEAEQAARLANLAASIVVGQPGTASIHRSELKAALYHLQATASQSKLTPQAVAPDILAQWKREGQRIGFTNGCFDILHAGHLQSLQEAKQHCDKLIVGINDDASVARIKGPTRPINREMDRASLIAGLDCVDMVILFREDTPLNLLELLKPDILMKGADYSEQEVVGAELVKAYGGKVILLPLKEGYSSSDIIARSAEAS